MNAQAAVQPFAFDLDLSGETQTLRARLERAETDLHGLRSEIEDQKRVAREEGRAEGQQSAEAEAAKKLADQMQSLAQQAASMLKMADRDRQSLSQQSAELSLAIGKHLAHESIAKFPAAELEALVLSSFQDLAQVPNLVVTLPESTAEDIRSRLATLLDEQGFAGRLIVKTDAEFADGDVRLQWSDGALLREMDLAEQKLKEQISIFLEENK